MLTIALTSLMYWFFSGQAIAATDPASISWDKILDGGGGSRIVFGAKILGPDPYSRNADQSFKPASTAKLVTAGNILEHFGPDYAIPTTLQWRRVDPADPTTITELTLIGSGDPTWGMDEFGEDQNTRVNALARELKVRGVLRVAGEIVAKPDDSRWNQLETPKGWSPGERLSCDGSLAQAFNMQRNCSVFVVTASNRGYWRDSGITTPVQLKIQPGKTTQLEVSEWEDGYQIRGTFHVLKNRSRSAVYLTLPVRKVDQWVKNLFVAALIRAGITLIPAATPMGEPAPMVETESITIYSPPLHEILKPFLKNSINVIGEALFKILGRGFGPSDAKLLEASEWVVADYLMRIAQERSREHGSVVDPRSFSELNVLWDGSGLSYDDKLTPTFLTFLLEDLRDRPDFGVIFNALPIAGVDGTLRNRMGGTPAQGVLRAKTGTLNGAYNLAGYVPRLDAAGNPVEFIPFVLLTDTNTQHENVAHAAEDRVGAELARIINRHSPQLW